MSHRDESGVRLQMDRCSFVRSFVHASAYWKLFWQVDSSTSVDVGGNRGIPYTADGVYHTITPQLYRFSMVDISIVGIMSVPKRSALGASRRELSEDVPFGIGVLLDVEQSTLENRRWCV